MGIMRKYWGFAVMAGVLLLTIISIQYIDAVISDGTVDSFQKISDTQGGLTGSPLIGNDRFGYSAVSIGDLNNNGVEDMAVGAALFVF